MGAEGSGPSGLTHGAEISAEVQNLPSCHPLGSGASRGRAGVEGNSAVVLSRGCRPCPRPPLQASHSRGRPMACTGRVCSPATGRCPERAGVCCSPTQCCYLVPRGNTAQAHTLFVLVLLSCLALCVSRAFLCTEVPEQCSRCVLAAGRLSPREGAHDISPLRWHHWN